MKGEQGLKEVGWVEAEEVSALCSGHLAGLPEFDLPPEDRVWSAVWMKPQKICIPAERTTRTDGSLVVFQ